MANLPTGTVTFLFTDIEGSTALWEQHRDAMRQALMRHDALVEQIVADHDGVVVRPRGEGDSRFAVFARATDAVAAAATLQQALHAEPWSTPTPLRVRMALHTGEADLREGDYYGSAVNRCARLRAVAYGGQILLSGATEPLVRDQLPPGAELRDLGQHRLKDLGRPEHIFQLVARDLPGDFPPLTTLEQRRHNLTIQLTSFIGRTRELAEITRVLTSTRLLTLVGPGGTGKTRLALQVAAEVLAAAPPRPSPLRTGQETDGYFPDGVWLVELAPLADPALVPQAVANALGLREVAGRPLLTTLRDFLRAKDLLLILDNCEHVVEACAHLADVLLRACPQMRILASSREALGIAGESAWRVPPLALPPGSLAVDATGPGWDAVAQSEAVRLFVERAAAARPGFSLTPQNAGAVVQMCRRLDGIPLAIELAAARLRVLGVEQIAAGLDNRFRLLTGGSRTALPRHQTLRALIDWSYDLLAAEEQVLLRRLAVFAGGWTLEAADAVMHAAGNEPRGAAEGATRRPGSSALDVLDGLAHLVDKSLVLVEEQGGQARYTMLETIRQYAAERLAASGEAETIRRRHAMHYLAVAETAMPQLHGREQGVWLDRLEVEHDNLLAALGWGLQGGDAEAGARLAIALAAPQSDGFWHVLGYWSEAERWLEAVLAQRDALSPGVQAWAIVQAAFHGWPFTGVRWEHLRAGVEEALALFRAIGVRSGIAYVHKFQGQVAWVGGDYGRATRLLTDALTMYRDLGDQYGIATVLDRLGTVARDAGDAERAVALMEQSLAMCREQGYLYESTVLNGLGEVVFHQGDLARATALYWEALRRDQDERNYIRAIWALRNLGWIALVQGDDGRVEALLRQHIGWFREREALQGITWLIHVLGAVINAQGDTEQATAILREGLVIQQQVGEQFQMIESLAVFAGVASGQGCARRAARLLAAAEALVGPAGTQQLASARWAYKRDLAAARDQLDKPTWEAAWAEGQAMTLEQAVAYALAADELA